MRTSTAAAARVCEAQSFGHCDATCNAASLDVAIVHRLREHRRNDEVAAVTRFDLIIDLERVRGRRHEEHRAIFPNIDVIDSWDGACPGAGRGIDNLEPAG